ncbi:signal transduction histidine kinase (STHK), LytS [Dolichospermum sp. FACHB-1091]|uniref:general stress protein n=1 Tax=Dolichospermum sp. FACHB-1091 TaxID=2692798 RepID=UPI001680F42A|nr:general stress protein [Dolichospermum sp. FACHB-1091]MBD2444700.1 signal transduction histidine kinase (STHK), LytS [Dolichospermum sp. FACHB-1091]
MTLISHKRAVGVFSSHQQAENALSELRDNGFAMNQVSVIAKDNEELSQSYRIGDTRIRDVTETTHVDEGAKTGLEAGGVVGGLTGLLVGLGTLAIPGVGPVMLAGAAATAIATTLAGGVIGAAVGGLLGGLVGLGIPEHRAQVYHDYVVNGNYLVIVDGTEAEILRAETILKNRGVREWEVYNSPATSRYTDTAVSRF